MQSLKIKLPKLSTKTVWIGSYGGHYSCVVIFHTKPKKVYKGWNSLMQCNYAMVDLEDNKKCIAACMWECDFQEIYPNAKIPPPKEIEVTTLYKRELEAFWNEKGTRIEFPIFSADGY